VIDVLDFFLPATRAWFRERYGDPTPPQTLGWPAIQRGENVLILSPTGSGKTLTAFLWGIDSLCRELAQDPELAGVRLLYVSPLKALNNDIARNLREPLQGVRHTARAMGIPLPAIHHAVRTGDTPQSLRQSMVRKPPHILITTPESLYLLLTSPKAREMLRRVRTVIVDEIHTLCGNKRGVHLALSLERLAHLTGRPFQRIGLSATQRPLDEVASFLAGQEWVADEESGEQLVSRQVTIVDAGMRKDMDLKVVTPVPDLRQLPGGSIWPSLIPQVLGDVRRHRTTLIFVNSRRGAERAADRLNEQYALEETEEIPPGSPSALVRQGVAVGGGMFGTGRVGGPFRAHHGSVSREVRLELEQSLKEGELPALIATSSLELGIDVGQVDAVVQLQSPRGIARGLQRVGRSGHLVGQTSVGRFYATHREDLLDAAVVAHGMLEGDIEPTHTPQNCLDVLAQQIVAAVAVDDWDAKALYRLVRQAHGYARLSEQAYRNVLRMLGGAYAGEVSRELRARLSWDRVHDRLAALPGSRLLALRNGGTIADRGEFRVYLPDGKTMLGTLDEEFVFETRKGDVFSLGTNTWRVLDIEEDRLVVGEAAGNMPRMPFWKGEGPKRDYHMGLRLGAFRRELARRVMDLPRLPDDLAGEWPPEAEPVLRWLAEDYALDEPSGRNAIHYVRQQLDVLGAISSDQAIVVELFHDALGDKRMAVHCPLGARVNSAWALALGHAMRERYGSDIEIQVNDDGILFHFADQDREPPVDVITGMGPDEARERLLLELPHSALFGAQFRMNASRALLLPTLSGGRRTPFWLQRLRARSLLAACKSLDDFPLITETFRSCLSEVLDLQHMMDMLAAIQSGDMRVLVAETIVPSPVAASLLYEFLNVAMYEGDTPQAEWQMQALTLNRQLLSELLDEELLPDLLRPEAIEAVVQEAQHLAEGYRARGPEELAVMLHELSDLTADEVAARCLGEGRAWLLRLAAEDRACEIAVPVRGGSERRWIASEDYWRYRDAFGLPETPPIRLSAELLEPHRSAQTAQEALLRLMARTNGPLTLDDIQRRYAFPDEWLTATLQELTQTGHLATGRISPGATERQWCDRRILERIHRRTLALLRKEVQAVDIAAYADFLTRWQGAHPVHRREGVDGLRDALVQLRGLALPAAVWERDLLPARLPGFRERLLDELCAEGELAWALEGDAMAHARLRFLLRGEGGIYLQAPTEAAAFPLSEQAERALNYIREANAPYAREIGEALGLSSGDLDEALVSLLLAGLVTSDHFGAARTALAWKPESAPSDRGLDSSLDRDLAAWRRSREPSLVHRPSAGRMVRARREVGPRVTPPTRWPGRWSATARPGLMGPELSPEERSDRQARLLLGRYGIVTRECLLSENGAAAWDGIYRSLQLMEWRGEVRRGYFVRGLSGVQFALPEAVESLRAWNRAGGEASAELVLLNAWDPALVYGPALSGRDASLGEGLPEAANPYRFARLPSNYVVLQRGVPILLYQHGGQRWVSLQGVSDELAREAVLLILGHLTREGGLCSAPRRVVAETWNGQRAAGSAGEPLLASLGFRREALAMTWDGL